MAVNLITGGAGSGKTYYLTEKAVSYLNSGEKVIFIVPEHAAVMTESVISEACEKKKVNQTELEILNFRRLANRVAKEYGGLCGNPTGNGIKQLAMWKAFMSCTRGLKYYSADKNSAIKIVPLLLTTIGEIRDSGVKAEDLKSIAGSDTNLINKITDIFYIKAEYEKTLEENGYDVSGNLDKLAKTLKEKDFFKDKVVFIDSFVGFTAPEYKIIENITKNASETFISLCISGNKRPVFAVTKKTKKRLEELVGGRKYLSIIDVEKENESRLNEKRKTKEAAGIETAPTRNREFIYLQKNFGNGKPKSSGMKANRISFFIGSDKYAEAEYIACNIKEKLRKDKSLRYRDMAVVCGSEEDLEVLDAMFSKHNLPFHTGVKKSLLSSPLFRLVIALLKLKSSGYSPDAVMAVVKSGLCGISDIKALHFEQYLRCWNITERLWNESTDWTMNPKGYNNESKSEKLLEEINQTRKYLDNLLRPISDICDGEHKVDEVSAALYTCLEEMNVLSRFKKEEKDEGVRIWNCLCDALDTLHIFIGNETISIDGYVELLTIASNGADTGNIPQKADEISISTSFKMRSFGLRYTWMFGCNEGVFPPKPVQNGLLTDEEKEKLEIDNGSDESQRSASLFDFYSALLSPSDGLVLTCTNNKQSPAFDEVDKMFPKAKKITETDAENDLAFIVDEKSAREYYGLYSGSEIGEAIKQVLGKDDNAVSLKNGDVTVPKDIIDNLERNEDGDVKISVSSMEEFIKCPLKYELGKNLVLKEDPSGEVGANVKGTFVHYILEHFFKDCYKEAKAKDGDERHQFVVGCVNDLASEYLAKCGVDKANFPADMNRFDYFKNSTIDVIVNMTEMVSKSSFQPAEFELQIGNDKVNGFSVDMDKTNKIIFKGKIDRIDKTADGDFIIIDYKTGTAEFDEKKIEKTGLGTQLLVYMFSQENADQNGCGMLYYPVYRKKRKTDKDLTEELKIDLSPNGRVLSDKYVLTGLEDELMYPKNANKKPKIQGMSDEGKKNIRTLVENKVREVVGDGILGEKFSPKPSHNNEKDGACNFCKFGNICRKKKKGEL